MKVLVVGSGGREHALVWKIAQSPGVAEILVAPGNAGTARAAKSRNVAIPSDDVDGLEALARREKPDLTVIGPEAPLTAGLVDRLQAAGLRAFGPRQAAARLECSKVFSKEVMISAGVPTARFEVFIDARKAADHIEKRSTPMVIKADGLAAGKGVIIAATRAEARHAAEAMLIGRRFGSAGDRIVVEDFLEGEEASFLCLCDGRDAVPLASSQDHKRVGDGDTGPNTGGMGAYSPAPVVTPEIEAITMDRVIRPVLAEMQRRGAPFVGVLYAGLMIHKGEPRVLEFNVRFGDPECQPLMMRLRSDLVEAMEACIEGRAGGLRLDWDPRPAVCVVMAAHGYPESYEKGKSISGLGEAERGGGVVFHAGTREENGTILTNGGRVLGVTALGDTLAEAVRRSYAAVDSIRWEGAIYRRDIAARQSIK